MHAVLSDCTSASERPESPTASSAARQQYLEASDMVGSSLFGIGVRSSLASTSDIAPATRLLRPRLSHSGIARTPLAPARRASTTRGYSWPRHEIRPTPVIATRRDAIASSRASRRPRPPLAGLDRLEKIAYRLDPRELLVLDVDAERILQLRRQGDENQGADVQVVSKGSGVGDVRRGDFDIGCGKETADYLV